MQLTKGAIGNLINRYKAVLKKCHLMNTFGSLAVAGMLVMGGAAAAGAADVETITPAQDSKILYYNGNLYFADDTPTDTVVKNDDDTITAKLTNQNATFGVLTNLRKENGGDVSSIKITNSFFANNTSGGAVTLWGMGTGQDTLTKSISDSKFDNNSSNGNGGAVGIHKNTAFTTLGSTTFTTVKFEENTADENGGAIFAEAEKLAINKNDFKNNKAKGYGGAIFITQSSELDVKDSVFTENHAAESGGAIASGTSSKSMTITSTRFINNAADGDGGAIGNFKGLAVKDSYFEDKKAQQSETHEGTPIGGGAIALGAESTTTIANTTFKNNTSGTNGGAIATRQAIHADNSAAKLDIAATFIGNKAQQGGAIYNSFYTDNGLGKGAGVTVTGTFSGNEATGKGGAIYNDGTLDKAGKKGGIMTITDATFDGNKADFGGAIFNTGTLTINDGSFEGNTATKVAGAIYNAADATLTVDGVTFADNSSAKAGAINSMAGKNNRTTTIKNSKFNNNSAVNGMGGALANSSNVENGSTEGFSGKMSLTDTAFSGNTARNGGALWNGVQWTVDITGGSFDNNSAVTPAGSTYPAQGGAISNSGTLNISGVTFSNNKTDGLGGAIFNTKTGGDAGSITFNGTNTFTNNTAASKANDIHNSGTITVASGTTTLGSGYSQDAGSLTVQGGAALESLGTMEISGGSVAFTDNSLFAVNGNALTGDNAAITVDGGRLEVEDKARLRIDNAKSGQTYTIVNKQAGTEQGKWRDGNIEASTDLLTPTMDNNGDVTFKRDKDASDVFTGMDSNTAAMLNTLIDKGLNNVDSDQMGVRFLSRATDNHFLGADKDAAAATIESAARIAFAGAVPQMTKMASDAGTNAVVNRLGFANPADGAQAMDAEGKIVDRNTTGFALWIAPLWQSQHGWGMEADNLDYGFNGNLGGVSLGADYTFENAIRAGITFNIGGGYAESSGGDLNSTENRMSFWGLGAYAGWNYENFGLMADVSYTSTWNDLKQEMDGRMGMGDLEADVQASAISAGLRAEYKLETSVLDVIPHIGVRYMSLNTWGYDVDADGGTVLEGDGFHQDIWTFPVGVTFTKDFTLDSGWSFKPSIDFSVIPAAGDIKAKQDVAFTGLPGSYEVETQMMDYLTWQGGVGLEMGNDTMSFGVNYTLQAGQHTTGHGVFGSFRYEF